MERLLERNFDYLTKYPKTKFLNITSDIFIKCKYNVKEENYNKFFDFSDCKKNVKELYDFYPSESKIFENYIKEFEKKPKEYMIEYMDNIILKNENTGLCCVNENRISTDVSRSGLFDITNNKHIFIV